MSAHEFARARSSRFSSAPFAERLGLGRPAGSGDPRASAAAFGGFFVTDLDIDWEDASYEAYGARPMLAGAGRDAADPYRLIRNSTMWQTETKFDGPFPNLHQPV